MQLQTKDLGKAGITKIAYTTAVVKSKSKKHGETKVMITYDVTCRKLPRLARLRHSQTVGKFPCQHISPRKVNHEFSKKFETAEIHIFNYP